MKIIISPAKKMNINPDDFPIRKLPVFLKETERLCREIRRLSYEEAKKLWKCNEKLAQLNYDRFADMNLERNLTPAILTYEGLQYQHMAPIVFTEHALAYAEEHLRILSGFYGVLSPLDGVVPYRLEMQAKLSVDGKRDLYDFWGDKLYRELNDRVIVNLASKEYAKCIEKYLTPEDFFLTCTFGELQNGKIVQKGTFAKMVRGEMVRYMAENNVQNTEDIKKFSVLGYRYQEAYSSEREYVFVKEDNE